MIPDGFFWNQADLENHHWLNHELVSILAFDPSGIPQPIGTGFIISHSGSRATVCTAAHNLIAIRNLQNPNPPHHSSALPMFLPKPSPLRIDGDKVRAVCFNGVGVEMAFVEWAVWDRSSDIANVGVRTQDGTAADFFVTCFLLDDSLPSVGDTVMAMGYEGMAITDFQRIGTGQKYELVRRLLLREGRISAVYPDGHELCRAPCVVTTIPMFPGMSGGPVALGGNSRQEMKPFGVISHDPNDGRNKYDRSLEGYSVVPLVRPEIQVLGDKKQMARLKFGDYETVGLTVGPTGSDLGA